MPNPQSTFANAESDHDTWEIEQPRAAAVPPVALVRPSPPPPRRPPASPAAPAASPTHSTAPWPHIDGPVRFPGFAARSALFGIGRGLAKTPAAARSVPSLVGSLSATGPGLTMRDKLAWEAVVRIARQASNVIGEPFAAPIGELAALMGIPDPGGSARRGIKASLDRLARATVAYCHPENGECAGALLAEVDARGHETWIRLDAGFMTRAFFIDAQFPIDSKRREAMKGCAMAQWLHDFYSTHSKAAELGLPKVRSLCGYDGKSKAFPSILQDGLARLVAAAPEIVASFEISKGRKSSEHWVVLAQLGNEKRIYKKAPGPSAAEKWPPQKASRRDGRGGVAL